MTALPMRLAFREEGSNWNAYLAPADSMKNAVYLGSIKMSFVVGNPDRRQRFIDLMKDAMGDAIKDVLGEQPTWNETVPAPESDRSGEA